MTVFLTPDGEPFYGGTYFPPEPRGRHAVVPQVLEGIAEAYRERRGDVEGQAAQLAEALRGEPAARPRRGGAEPRRRSLTDALLALRGQLDERHGGFGGAPKFPPSMRALVPPAHAPPARQRRGRCAWPRSRSTAWPRAASTTSSAAASTATPSTRSGSCRTSRRCSTTTRCSRAPTCRRYAGDRREPPRRGRRSDARLPACASCACRTAATPRRPTPTPTASEGTTFVWTPAEVRALLGDEAALVEALYGITDGGQLRGRDGALARARARRGERRARACRPSGCPRCGARHARGARLRAAAGTRRQGARVLERHGPRRARRGRPRARPAGPARGRRAVRRVPARPALARPTAPSGAPTAPAAARSPGFLDDHAQVAEGLWQLHRSHARPALARRGAAARAAGRRRASPTPRARLVRHRRGRRAAVARPRTLDDDTDAVGRLDARPVAGAHRAGSTGTTSWRAGRAPPSRSAGALPARAPQAFGNVLCVASSLLGDAVDGRRSPAPPAMPPCERSVAPPSRRGPRGRRLDRSVAAPSRRRRRGLRVQGTHLPPAGQGRSGPARRVN